MTRHPMLFIPAVLLPYAAVWVGLYGLRNGWVSMLMYHAGVLLFLSRANPRELMRDCRRGFPPGIGWVAVIVCALSGGLLLVLWPFLGAAPDQLFETLSQFGFTRTSFAVFILYAGLVHAALEELHWRPLGRNDHRVLSPIDLAFAGYHAFVLILFVPPALTALSIAILAGVSAVWRWMARRFDGYALPILTHAVADISILAAVYFLIRP